MKTISTVLIIITIAITCCKSGEAVQQADAIPSGHANSIASKGSLPAVGIILFDEVLLTEVTAPIDVFSKTRENGTKIFDVVTVAETLDPVTTEGGLRVLPDYTFANCPKLTVLVVPSAYDMTEALENKKIVNFIKQQNASSKFTMSNCSGAQLIGESGVANGRKIVTYIGGGKDLKEKYPALEVQDDESVCFVKDGKFFSSNGNLASYVSALELLEKLSGKEHRQFVESYLYLQRLTDSVKPEPVSK